MFKKIHIFGLFLIVCSPMILALAAGYPLRRQALPDGSRRCFKVGELGQFISCYREGNRLMGTALARQIEGDLSAFSPLFAFALPLLLTIAAVVSALIAFESIPVEKEKLQHPVNKKKR